MTTFQDPPPQSRRAVRQSERGETPTPMPDQGAPYAFDAAQSAPAAPPVPAASPQTGRRASPPRPEQEAPAAFTENGAAPGFEPLTYSTQGRVSPPIAEQSQQQPLAAAPPPGSPDQSNFRVRDFSPEGGRRAAPTASPAFPAPMRQVDLDYQTEGVPTAPPRVADSAPLEDTMNHTLSRRELREMRAAAEQDAPPLQAPSGRLPESIDTLLNSGPIDIPTLAPPPGQSQALAEAMAEFDMLTRSRREAEARARDAQVASLATPIIPAQQPSAPVAPLPQAAVPEAYPPQTSAQPPTQAPAPQQYAAEQSAAESYAAEQYAAEQHAEQQRAAEQYAAQQYQAAQPQQSAPQAPAAQAPMRVDPVFIEPQQPDVQTPADAHGGRSPRASNHWRVQAAIEDDELPYENTLSRTVGSNTSAITTSALVLPSVPQPDSMLASISATGEILVTGSINLPRSLGSTGAHPARVDNSDFEDDPFDSQVAAPDSAPVRAIRAISSNTSTRGVIETKKPQGNRALTAVIIVAGVLCVGLVSLLIFAFANGKL